MDQLEQVLVDYKDQALDVINELEAKAGDTFESFHREWIPLWKATGPELTLKEIQKALNAIEEVLCIHLYAIAEGLSYAGARGLLGYSCSFCVGYLKTPGGCDNCVWVQLVGKCCHNFLTGSKFDYANNDASIKRLAAWYSYLNNAMPISEEAK